MSIYPSPKFNHGVLNSTFNNSDYIQTNTGGSGLTITQTDAKYLQISGVTTSSAQTTFQNTVDFKSLLTTDNIKVNALATIQDIKLSGILTGNVSSTNIQVTALSTLKDVSVSGLLTGNVSSTNIQVSDLGKFKNLTVSNLFKSTQTSDTLTTDFWRTDQVYSFTNGMVYSKISESTAVNSVSFINIPTTINQSYIFTFIIQPSVVNSPFFIKSNTNTINVNGVAIPLYGLQNVSLPANYTYLVQQISIIYNLYAADPKFLALTSISAY
jgi:hypothetical protein